VTWFRRPKLGGVAAAAPTPDPGLCASCRHHRIVETRRGSRFWLCALSRVDPAFPRYPRLPVLACRGYAQGEPPADGDTDGGSAHADPQPW
jgi:hypothetical protein